MIVRTVVRAVGSEREVHDPRGDWVSYRLLLAGDGVGFSLHQTVVRAGAELRLHYRNHIEAVMCVNGSGEIEALETGETHAVVPGTLYVLDRHDRHCLRAFSELTLVCVFNPALVGGEIHDGSGSYPPPERVETGSAGRAPLAAAE